MTARDVATLPVAGGNGGMYFEDYFVGQRIDGPPWRVTDPDADPPLPGTRIEARWRYLAPTQPGDTLHTQATVTRCARGSDGDFGSVNQHVVVLDPHGQRIREGTVTVLVPARGPGEDAAALAFGTVPWARAVAERLAGDERFASATAEWDGTLGLRCGDAEVHLRIYRGRVIDVTRRSPHGATFTVEAGELAWTELLTGPRNDFIRRAMRGEFDVRGSAYEYLRLTKAVVLLVDGARAILTEGEQG
jgi:hypothetical protein